MNQLLDNEQFQADLTRDILSDADLARLCAATAKTARRRRTIQHTRVPILMALLIAIFAFFPKEPRQTIVTNPLAPAAPVLAHTVVSTEPFANIIRSEPAATFSTPNELAYRLLTDDELLHLLDGHAIAFHRAPSGRLQIEFLGAPQIQ